MQAMVESAAALLQDGKPARDLAVDKDEIELFLQMQLLSAKPVLYVCNVDEDAAAEQERVEAIEDAYMERLQQERDAEVPETTAADTSLPTLDGADRGPPATPSKDTPFDDDSESAQPLGAQVPARDPQ